FRARLATFATGTSASASSNRDRHGDEAGADSSHTLLLFNRKMRPRRHEERLPRSHRDTEARKPACNASRPAECDTALRCLRFCVDPLCFLRDSVALWPVLVFFVSSCLRVFVVACVFTSVAAAAADPSPR